ncbi:MAG: low molecular weight protein-tyrosine-phosphatase [Anaerolineales bacterium]|nr:low molecular weight protein-tyrosine-phosphatase [Anaerolineales bacterium]
MVKVLFVCMGNICRSPMAEGVFAHFVSEAGLADLISTDSAGTIGDHMGQPPDERAQETALKYGVEIEHLRARQFRADDFDRFHYILAMDKVNLHQLNLARPDAFEGRLQLFCDFAPKLKGRGNEVPDPYFGGAKGFEKVFRLVSVASEGLLDAILREHYPDHARGG